MQNIYCSSSQLLSRSSYYVIRRKFIHSSVKGDCYSLRDGDKLLYKMEYYRKIPASKVTEFWGLKVGFSVTEHPKLYVLENKLWNSVICRCRRNKTGIRFHMCNKWGHTLSNKVIYNSWLVVRKRTLTSPNVIGLYFKHIFKLFPFHKTKKQSLIKGKNTDEVLLKFLLILKVLFTTSPSTKRCPFSTYDIKL